MPLQQQSNGPYLMTLFDEKVKSCFSQVLVDFNSEVCEMSLNRYGWSQRANRKNSS